MFGQNLIEKPQVVAINKTDLPLTRERIKKDIDMFQKKGIKILPFSAATGEGVDAAIKEIVKKLSLKKVRE
jgi:GTP-binding protein